MDFDRLTAEAGGTRLTLKDALGSGLSLSYDMDTELLQRHNGHSYSLG